jgi:death-on-curing protein
MDSPLQTLTDAEIIEINRIMVSEFGGLPFAEETLNLHNPESLYYLVDAIQGSVFGQEIFPTIFAKAAAFPWHIITRHTFNDGNKRTGMEACRVFLELNGYALRMDEGVIGIALWIAQGKVTQEELVEWVEHSSTQMS